MAPRRGVAFDFDRKAARGANDRISHQMKFIRTIAVRLQSLQILEACTNAHVRGLRTFLRAGLRNGTACDKSMRALVCERVRPNIPRPTSSSLTEASAATGPLATLGPGGLMVNSCGLNKSAAALDPRGKQYDTSATLGLKCGTSGAWSSSNLSKTRGPTSAWLFPNPVFLKASPHGCDWITCSVAAPMHRSIVERSTPIVSLPTRAAWYSDWRSCLYSEKA